MSSWIVIAAFGTSLAETPPSTLFSGPLDKAVLDERLQSSWPRLEDRCFAVWGGDHAEPPTGTIAVRYTVGMGGTIRSYDAPRVTPGMQSLAPCVITHLLNVSLPQANQESTVETTFSFSRRTRDPSAVGGLIGVRVGESETPASKSEKQAAMLTWEAPQRFDPRILGPTDRYAVRYHWGPENSQIRSLVTYCVGRDPALRNTYQNLPSVTAKITVGALGTTELASLTYTASGEPVPSEVSSCMELNGPFEKRLPTQKIPGTIVVELVPRIE